MGIKSSWKVNVDDRYPQIQNSNTFNVPATGATKDQTKDSYCGPKAWSEKCVVNLKQTLEQLQPRLKVYMTIHTYGQMWFIPYAWSRQAYPADYGKQVSTYSLQNSTQTAVQVCSWYWLITRC